MKPAETTGGIGRRPRVLLILAAALGLALLPVGAGAVSFVTRQAWLAEEFPHKEYPYRILFQKFHASQGKEKRALRNVILLRQVFEGTPKGVDPGVLDFQPHTGVIRGLGTEALRLWVPREGSERMFHVGIDRIPLANPLGSEVNEINIGEYASRVHTLDGRVYKVEIVFPLLPPVKLRMVRKQATNSVAWDAPVTDPKPVAYRVFVNGTLEETVEGTRVDVPRSGDRADVYRIEAVYRYDGAHWFSRSTEPLMDTETAEHLTGLASAENTFDEILSALKNADWETARKLVSDQENFLQSHLPKARGEAVRALAGFFRNLEEGDRIADREPVRLENLELAQTFYRRAERQAKTTEDIEDAAILAEIRIRDVGERSRALAAEKEEEIAGQVYRSIIGELTPSGWERARNRLQDHHLQILSHLDRPSGEVVIALQRFFVDLEEGDRLLQSAGNDLGKVEAAFISYQRARKTAGSIADEADLGFLIDEKFASIQDRRASLESERQAREAKARERDREEAERKAQARIREREEAKRKAQALIQEREDAERKAQALIQERKEAEREAEALIREREEAERKAQALIQEREEAERKTQALIREREEAERKAQALIQEREEAERKAQTLIREREQAERKAQALIQEREEAERKAQALIREREQAERKAQALIREREQAEQKAQTLIREREQAEQKAQTLIREREQAEQKAQALIREREDAERKAQALIREREEAERKALVLIREREDAERKALVLIREREQAEQKAQALIREREDAERKALVLIREREDAERETGALMQEWEEAERKAAALKREREEAERESEALIREREEAEREAEALIREREEAEREAEALIREREEAERKAEALMREREEAKRKAEALMREREEAERKAEALMREREEAERKAEALMREREEAERKAEALMREREEAERKAEALMRERQEAERTAQAQKHEQKEIEQKALEQRRAKEEVEREAETLERERAEIERKAKALEREREEIERQKEALEQDRARTVVKQDMDEPVGRPAAPSAAVRIPRDDRLKKPAFSSGAYEPRTALRMAMTHFQAGRYASALDLFRGVYGGQIEKLYQGGKKQAIGILGIAPQYRAEVLFLVQLDQVQRHAEGRSDLLQKEIADLEDAVDNGLGPWSIIPEAKKGKIRKHLEGLRQ